MKTLIPSALHSYTKQSEVNVRGDTLAELLIELDQQYPGIRFRIVDEQDCIRSHMRFFINNIQINSLEHPLKSTDSICLVQALSGG